MTKPQILLIGGNSFDLDPWNKLVEEHGYELVPAHPNNRKELLEYLNREGANVEVIVNSYFIPQAMKWDRDLIDKTPRTVKMIAQQGSGYENVGPIDAWRARGVQVANSPNAVARPTADCGAFLVMAVVRNYQRATVNLREGNWRGDYEYGRAFDDLTVGIVGMGNIGRAIRDRLLPFGFKKYQYHNRSRLSPELEKGAAHVSYDELLKTSDVIIFAIPHSAASHHMLNAEKLKLVKPDVDIVNIARGPIIDEQALVDALEENRVHSVGLDVFEHEPEINPGLLKHKNAFLLPHVAGFDSKMLVNVRAEMFSNVEAFVKTGHVISLVPELR